MADDKKDYVQDMLDKAEKGQMGGTLRGSRPEGQPVPRPQMPQILKSLFPTVKNNLPSGASQSPKGDLGALRGRELGAAFPRPIKNSGKTPSNPLTYSAFDSANDYGDGASTR